MTNWIIPMCGKGKGLQLLGDCKPMINVEGKTILEWCILGIQSKIKKDDTIIGITTNKFQQKYDILSYLKKYHDKSILIENPYTPNGQAETLKTIAAEELKPVLFSTYGADDVTIVINVDQHSLFEFPKNEDWDIFIPLYFNDSDRSSYAMLGTDRIKCIKEKNKISNYAIGGIFGFKTFYKMLDILKLDNIKINNEYYLSTLIDLGIGDGNKVIPTKMIMKHDLGSYEGIKQFKEYINQWK